MASSGPTGFLGRSSSSNSNMRGLVQFIADLRNARARELEEKRINKELANIRQKFKGLRALIEFENRGSCVWVETNCWAQMAT